MSDELPEGWTRSRLDAITTTIQYGYTASADHSRQGPRMLRITDIQDGRVDWASVPGCKISSEDLAKYQVVAGDIVFARSGATTGKSFLIEEAPPEAVFASYLIRVRANRQIVEPAYLARFFQSPDYWAYISENVAGNAQPNCNGSKLAAIELPLPPLPEQRRIVTKVEALLARVNAAREHSEKVPLLLKRFRQSVLAKAFRGELTETWREDRGLSADWGEASIEELASVGTGSTPLRSNAAFFAANGTPWITSAATGSPFVTQAQEFVTPAAITEHRLKKYPVGTLLVAMYGEGKTRGQVTELRIEATINQACAAIVVNESRAASDFVKLLLEGSYFQMREKAEGGNQPNLNLTKIREFPVPLPPLAEQQEIVAVVRRLLAGAEALETAVERARHSLDRVPQAILQRAFVGELVPNEAELAADEGREFESAEELLRRVSADAATSETTTALKKAGAKARGRPARAAAGSA